MPSSQQQRPSRAFEQRALRDALGRFATGVTVMTVRGPGGEALGITVNSFTSVSLEPPLILWCLALNSAVVDLFNPGTPFAVNMLADDQLRQARQFARSGPSEIQGTHFTTTASGLALLEGCVEESVFVLVVRHPILLGQRGALRSPLAATPNRHTFQ